MTTRGVTVAVRTRPTAVFAQDQVLLDLEQQVCRRRPSLHLRQRRSAPHALRASASGSALGRRRPHPPATPMSLHRRVDWRYGRVSVRPFCRVREVASVVGCDVDAPLLFASVAAGATAR
jgi:hypothetical protein